MTDPVTIPVDTEDAVAEAIAAEVTGTEEQTLAPVFEDPWQKKALFLANLSIDGADEAIGNAKRLLGLAEEAAMACEPKDRADHLMALADRWKYMASL